MCLKSFYISFVFMAFIVCFSQAQEGKIVINQDDRISELLKLKKEMNRSDTDSKRYKIQIYSGNRNGAKNAQNNFSESFGQWQPVMYYEEPNFKIWVGNFNTRLEADRALKRIKNKFPAAFIFKPKR